MKTLAFAHPGLLWLALLSVPLVVLYVLKVRREERVVPSTRLLREALTQLEAQVPFQRLRKSVPLLLELLALLLLALAAAGPHRRFELGPAGRTAIVLDTSASMRAGARFPEALRVARALIDGADPGTDLAIVHAGPSPVVAATLGSDRRSILGALDRAEPGVAGADLVKALRLARSLVGEDGSLVLVTDGCGTLPKTPGLVVHRVGGADRVDRRGVGAAIDRVGEDVPNTGIVALDVRPRDASGLSHEAFVKLKNASPAAASGTLELRVSGQTLNASRVDLPAGGEVARTLRLEGVSEGDVEVVWEAESPDAFPLDDRAYWVLRGNERRALRVVGEPDPYLRRALDASVDLFRETGDPPDVELVLATSPSAEGPPFLWIDPHPAGGSVTAGSSAEILRWDRTHPALRFVDLADVVLGSIPSLKRLPGSRVLAESTAGPLLLEGVLGTRRYLLLACDPLETDLPLRVAYPLFVRNALSSLAAGAAVPGGVSSQAAQPVPRSLGFQTVESGGKTPRARRIGVSLLDADESDLTPRSVSTGPATSASPATGRLAVTTRGLLLPLGLLVLTVLLLDALAVHRRIS